MGRIGQVLLIGSGALLCTTLSAATISVNIEAQRLKHALKAWAHQPGLQMLLHAPRGANSPTVALKVLLTPSALDYEFVNTRAVAIKEKIDSRGGSPKQHLSSLTDVGT
jgi:hypothetical protein